MASFGASSKAQLDTVHPRLKELFNEVVKTFDCKVICGYRTQGDQDKAFEAGLSKVQWPNSKHNSYPSLAVDVAPYPVDWKDLNRFYHFGGYVRAVADRLGIKIRWGGDWDGDFDLKDQNFFDLPHFELVEEGHSSDLPKDQIRG